MLTLRRLPAAAWRHPDPLLRFYFEQLGDHWPAHRWFVGRSLAVAAGEGAWLGIPAAERRLISGRLDARHYVSMPVRRGIHRLLNPAALPMRANLLKDKAAFARFAENQGLATPLTVTRECPAELLERDDIVLKPSFSSSGNGVVRARRAGRAWQLSSGERLTRPELALRVRRMTRRGGIVQEAVRTHPALARISPGALPTARVVTIHAGGERPAAGIVLVRLGRGESATDNSDGGGLAVLPGSDGRLDSAWANVRGALTQVETHPATGEGIARTLPPELLEGAVKLAVEAHACLPRGFAVVGWDVGLGTNGPILIEGNWNPGTGLPQWVAGAGLSQMWLGTLYRRALERVEPERWASAGALELDR